MRREYTLTTPILMKWVKIDSRPQIARVAKAIVARKSDGRNTVWVRVPLPALDNMLVQSLYMTVKCPVRARLLSHSRINCVCSKHRKRKQPTQCGAKRRSLVSLISWMVQVQVLPPQPEGTLLVNSIEPAKCIGIDLDVYSIKLIIISTHLLSEST